MNKFALLRSIKGRFTAKQFVSAHLFRNERTLSTLHPYTALAPSLTVLKTQIMRRSSQHYEFVENDPINDNFEFTEIEKDVLRNSTLQTPGAHGTHHTYGGIICAHALAAADKTVPSELNCHSFQCNFIIRVDQSISVQYHVTRVFDGRSFVTRSVECKQEGVVKFVALVAYHKLEPHSIEHQSTIPSVPNPADCEDFDVPWAFTQAFTPAKHRIDYEDVDFTDINRPRIFQAHEMRCIDPRRYHTTRDTTAKHYFWTRYKFPIEDTRRMHVLTLLYISDTSNNLLVVNSHLHDGFHIAMQGTLSHAMYFHGRPFNANEWMLIEMESTNAAHGRGLARGQIWNERGDLIASYSQEVVMRAKKDEEAKM
ncbi:hypothetical protein PMAYCL1PPCAC_32169 [Pristionchus mayeri]|uniref:Uncharacterized protein n=1 Tax=Pristionchus mayeri TaxID=1317129 RepID=A0AAN5DHI9_9BILA|nr:hypothetical protein PMAYCL1PPCAC_32169 [Pristionchus mayeri]